MYICMVSRGPSICIFVRLQKTPLYINNCMVAGDSTHIFVRLQMEYICVVAEGPTNI